MKKTIFEEMGGTYIRHGDYLIPALTLPKEEEQRVVGVWGQRHLRYLKEYRRLLYLNMLTSGRLNGYLADIEEQAQKRFERIVEQMAESEGITEQLKANDQVAWVGEMNNIWSRARAVVNAELIYN
mgnify:FL=1